MMLQNYALNCRYSYRFNSDKIATLASIIESKFSKYERIDELFYTIDFMLCSIKHYGFNDLLKDDFKKWEHAFMELKKRVGDLYQNILKKLIEDFQGVTQRDWDELDEKISNNEALIQKYQFKIILCLKRKGIDLKDIL